MAINIFVFSIIIFSIILTNFKVDDKVVKKEYKNVPLVTFENSIMYDIDDENIKQIVQSRQALNYKDRDELYDATIITRNDKNSSDTISAEYMLKQNDIYKLYQNVHLMQSDTAQLTTDFLVYNPISKIGYNDTDFILNYNDNTLVGRDLYFDGANSIIKAKNTHFKLKVQER